MSSSDPLVDPHAGSDAAAPAQVESLDDVVRALGLLRVAVGSPSYAELARRVGEVRAARGETGAVPGRVTVYDCFRSGRARLDHDLVVDLVLALGGSAAQARAWRAALQSVVAAEVIGFVDVRPLPPADPGSAGRIELLADLAARPPGSTVVISGLPGAGKTDLALRVAAAWRASGVGPTSGVYLDLQGHEDTAPPARSVLDALLTRLGVPAAELRALDVDQRADLWRRRIDALGSVVLLDSARDERQVELLLPRRGRARMLVTSRRRLPGLPGHHLDLAELSPQEAWGLMSDRVGADRLAAEPDQARRLIAMCGHLPLDLNVLAAAIVQRPSWSLADHARRLEAIPLEELRRPALTASYRQLHPEAQRAYRLLTLHPSTAVSVDAAAALTDREPAVARELLEVLDREYLVRIETEPGPGTQVAARLHDVSRTHARRLLDDEEPGSAQHEAVRRLADHLVDRSRQVQSWIAPGREPTSGVGILDRVSALDWMDRHRATVLAVAAGCIDWDLADQLGELSVAMWDYLDFTGRFTEAEALDRAVVAHGPLEHRPAAYQRLGRTYELIARFTDSLQHLEKALEFGIDDAGKTLTGIGNTLKRMGRYDEAAERYTQAVLAAREAGDRMREGRSLGNLADIHRLTSRYPEAAAAYDEALALSSSQGDINNVANILCNSALLASQQGDLPRAVELSRRAIDEARSAGLTGFLAAGLSTLGVLQRQNGDLHEARASLLEAIERGRESQLSVVVVEAQTNLGQIALALGELDEAVELLTTALSAAVEQGQRQNELDARNGLAEAVFAAGDPAAAWELHVQAHAMATEQRDVLEIGRALLGLGHAHAALGRVAEARESWVAAQEVFAGAGHPFADAIPPLLAELPDQSID